MPSFEPMLEVTLKNYPKKNAAHVSYGTAGFRMKDDSLDYIVYRVGILAALRSQDKTAVIGVMITASHNPISDNGVKIVDPYGEMLEAHWEKFANKIINCSDEELAGVIQSIINESNINSSQTPQVYVGMDTRPSSKRLSAACLAGVETMGGKVADFGFVTTPQLHYMVWSYNSKSTHQPTMEGYYRKISDSFKRFLKLCKHTQSISAPVTIDGANGIGALKAGELQTYLGDSLSLKVVFDGTAGVLNDQCGADYVKSKQTSPVGLDTLAGERYASVDGDADRVVYYYKSKDDVFHLLDGDKLAILMTSYLKRLLNTSKMSDALALGLVQTAYANGASTDYITQQLDVPVACTKTGVKHLHHAALDYDIGVYFEANGHGTIVFSKSANNLIAEAASRADASTEEGVAVLKLHALSEIINQVVGDALSDIVVIEAILADENMSMEDWDKQYTDLPNVLTTVKVEDRSVIQTTNAERTVTNPEGLQAAIDNLVAQVSRGRSFVRPSGTENIVRVYAEAGTKDEANKLATGVVSLVKEMCN
ncbi:phosphoacetylglucosamine mutase-like isoform X2 [Watersipora subatra]|uniref:phosphoacetylglucosamine mutase-like isoform X2 n=1 Tax=Watersipora subatra TaxID=2589382 RepID=UPI00355B873C